MRARSAAGGAVLAVLLAAVLSTLPGPWATPAAAQEDFRGLDQGRPVQVVDAYPIKHLEWEAQIGLRGVTAPPGEEVAATLELGTGLLPNLEVGLEVEPAWTGGADGGSFGVHGVGGHLHYNVNHEGWRWPAFAVRLEAEAPLGGGAGREGWGWGGRLVGTRSLATRTRVHANAGYRVESARDGGDVWVGGVAVDHPAGLVGRLLVGDVWVEVPVDAGRTRVLAEVGARFQWTNHTVLDLGVGTRLDRWEEGADLRLSVGLSRSFGLPALTPVPPWPEPSIR